MGSTLSWISSEWDKHKVRYTRREWDTHGVEYIRSGIHTELDTH